MDELTIPSFFQFYNPVKILAGNNALESLPAELLSLKLKKPLIVTDKGIKKVGLIDHVINAFKETNFTLSIIYDDVPQDSSTIIVNEIAKTYTEQKCDSLIAIGGGSVIDSTKAANVLITENSTDLKEFSGLNILKNPLQPLIVIPTSGTGSEVTGVAVVKDPDRNLKMAFSSDYLFPKVAVIDPRMTETLPPRMCAATAMDGISHAIESYTCLQKNPMSDTFASNGLHLLYKNIIGAIKNPKGKNHRYKIALGATLAGIALANSIAGVVHGLGHAIGGLFKTPHGEAMNIFLPEGLEYNKPKIAEILGELLLPLKGSKVYNDTHKDQRADKVIEIIKELREELYTLTKLPRNLKEAGIPETELENIAKKTIKDGSIAYNPVEVDYEDALSILRSAFD